jgi:hypothetical protein
MNPILLNHIHDFAKYLTTKTIPELHTLFAQLSKKNNKVIYWQNPPKIMQPQVLSLSEVLDSIQTELIKRNLNQPTQTNRIISTQGTKPAPRPPVKIRRTNTQPFTPPSVPLHLGQIVLYRLTPDQPFNSYGQVRQIAGNLVTLQKTTKNGKSKGEGKETVVVELKQIIPKTPKPPKPKKYQDTTRPAKGMGLQTWLKYGI